MENHPCSLPVGIPLFLPFLSLLSYYSTLFFYYTDNISPNIQVCYANIAFIDSMFISVIYLCVFLTSKQTKHK